jgi:chromate transporter
VAEKPREEGVVMIILLCLRLLYTFFIIGIAGFGGGYAMMSMILTESAKFGVTTAQMADLNALDMIVPGPIAINAATYVGYLSGGGFWGALTATIGVSLPSLIIVSLVMRVIARYRENRIVTGFLSGVKPAAVGLIAAAAFTIAAGVLLQPGATTATLLLNPLGTLSLPLVGIFAAVAAVNIGLKVNPILLTLAAGVIGAIFLG